MMAQPPAEVELMLMIVAKAVAVLNNRLEGRTAASSVEDGADGIADGISRPILPLLASVNHKAPSGPAVIPPALFNA
jgi:hypothetical protein